MVASIPVARSLWPSRSTCPGARLTVVYRLVRKGQTASVNHLALEGIVASVNM